MPKVYEWPEDKHPDTPDEYALALKNPWWRLNNLYWVKDEDSKPVKFRMRPIQSAFFKAMWFRNIILKARQLGFTTAIDIFMLDSVMFSESPIHAGIIAHKDESAKNIFRNKIKFAYNRLPDVLRDRMPLARNSADSLEFTHNGASIQVSTSLRSDTLQYLHVSEHGKICAKFPDRAEEIKTGTLPTVHQNGMVFVESTAEGAEGDFHDWCQQAKAMAENGRRLTRLDFKLHFHGWYEDPKNCLSAEDAATVIVTEKDHDYFDALEGNLGITLRMGQRAWYVKTAEKQGDKMRQEHPSTPEEAFERSIEGCYYTKQLAAARSGRRIVPHIPVVQGTPCDTYWDIGNSDGTAIWVRQQLGGEHHLIRFYEAWGEPYSHAATWLQGLGLVFGTHYLPHDADHVRQGQTTNKSPKQMLEELMPGHRFEIVPRIQDVNWGIQQTRDIFPSLYFDETHCKDGITHLQGYRKKWNTSQSCWMEEPSKEGNHSEAADAIRQFAQSYRPATPKPRKRKKGNWRAA